MNVHDHSMWMSLTLENLVVGKYVPSVCMSQVGFTWSVILDDFLLVARPFC